MDVLGMLKSKLGVKKPQEKPMGQKGFGVAPPSVLKNKMINRNEKSQLMQLEAEEFEMKKKAAMKNKQGYNY